jgi:glycosyltransferase involved in cell wall biosynthesis
MLNRQPTVSVIIKALNEERNIARAIESALAALNKVDGEIILADGGSSDRTVEIASRYPITIVQLTNASDRSCGSGAQLGFQYSSGRYLFLMDGDHRLHDEFIPAAINVLENNSAVAGVGGHIIECQIVSLEFEQRNKRHDPDRHAGFVTRLHGCGLYRRSAIEAVGYSTDRNLHGAEELDLAARLHVGGWTLVRIDRPAIDHYGHTEGAYRLLFRRVANRNAFATGELLRAALGRPHLGFLIRKEHNFRLFLLVAGWWITAALIAFTLTGWSAVFATAVVVLFPLFAMSWRWRSIRLGLYSLTAWNVYTLSFFPGFLRPRRSPVAWIESRILKTCAPWIDRAAAISKTSPRTFDGALHAREFEQKSLSR